MFVLWYAYVALYLLACHAIIAYSVSLIIIGELEISTVFTFLLLKMRIMFFAGQAFGWGL